LSKEADDRLMVELPKKGVKIDKVDRSQFAKATESVTAMDQWPIGDYVKKVVGSARQVRTSGTPA
jgi:hypothetical protein